MLSDADIYRAAHLILHQYGDDAELEAARCADRMFGPRGDAHLVQDMSDDHRDATRTRGSATLIGAGAVTPCVLNAATVSEPFSVAQLGIWDGSCPRADPRGTQTSDRVGWRAAVPD